MALNLTISAKSGIREPGDVSYIQLSRNSRGAHRARAHVPGGKRCPQKPLGLTRIVIRTTDVKLRTGVTRDHAGIRHVNRHFIGVGDVHAWLG